MVGTVVGLLWTIPEWVWDGYWEWKMWYTAILGVVGTVWFCWGGMRDARRLLRDLRAIRRDEQDDGTVPLREAAHYQAVTPGTGGRGDAPPEGRISKKS